MINKINSELTLDQLMNHKPILLMENKCLFAVSSLPVWNYAIAKIHFWYLHNFTFPAN